MSDVEHDPVLPQGSAVARTCPSARSRVQGVLSSGVDGKVVCENSEGEIVRCCVKV